MTTTSTTRGKLGIITFKSVWTLAVKEADGWRLTGGEYFDQQEACEAAEPYLARGFDCNIEEQPE